MSIIRMAIYQRALSGAFTMRALFVSSTNSSTVQFDPDTDFECIVLNSQPSFFVPSLSFSSLILSHRYHDPDILFLYARGWPRCLRCLFASPVWPTSIRKGSKYITQHPQSRIAGLTWEQPQPWIAWISRFTQISCSISAFTGH